MATSQAKQALRQYRRENSLCIHCGAEAVFGTRCAECKKRDAENRKRYLARDKAAGICITLGCKNKAMPERVYCDTCTKKRAKREAKKKRDGFCLKCSELATNGAYCAKHAKARSEYMRKFRDKRIAEGRCASCGNYNLDGSRGRCAECLDRYTLHRRLLKLAVMTAYGGPVCVGCGEDEIMILQIDHIRGGGTKHAREIGGRGRLYLWLRNNGYPPGFRVLCPNCNVRAARGLPFPNDKA